eukprot:51463_1
MHIFRIILCCLLIKGTYSHSACDPTDVFFLVDTATVVADTEGLIKLIDSVISSGSNEETGFSVIIWGDNVPSLRYGQNDNNDNSILCEISETTAIHHRPKQIKDMNNILQDAFVKIQNSVNSNSQSGPGKTVEFETALNYAKKKQKLMIESIKIINLKIVFMNQLVSMMM